MKLATQGPCLRAQRALLLLLTSTASILHAASDWPQWLGPNRDGSTVASLPLPWPKDGPPQLWRQSVGQGFSSPVAQGDQVALFHRRENQEVLTCYDSRSGRQLWEFADATRYVDDFGFDEGPRATPAVEGDRVYTFGAEGVLHCLNWKDGTKLWRVDTAREFGAPKGFFGMACSPLVEGDLVLLNIGGRNDAGIVALDKKSGRMIWKATRAEASYASPIAVSIGPRRYGFFFNREGLVALDPATGRIDFEFPWRPATSASVNASTPLVVGKEIFLSTSYSRGAILLRLEDSGPVKVWASDDALSCHYTSSVVHQGRLYGFHGRQEQGCILRCVDWATGRVLWSEPGLGAGSILLANDRLLILTEKGQLLTAPSSPVAFQPDGTAQVLGFDVRATPALARGLLFARDKRQLICLDLETK